MKALLLEGKGLADEMKVGELEKPKPGQGEILVKIKAAALNPVDIKRRMAVIISFAHPLSFHQVALGSVHQSNNPTQLRMLAQMGDHMLSLLQQGQLHSLLSEISASPARWTVPLRSFVRKVAQHPSRTA
ncbi:hypothetical protein [Paenibacillus apis]|uniref:Uncharacterized protein n=1 Tax=Paenibacillus apis TaxID=1792174 RepID=A0A919XW35_9BACL|nr:hypothetical protein [Paenibacillus apis]GIO40356.1 hypothetical protein J41TS4_01140 [Paenibacillus apis]